MQVKRLNKEIGQHYLKRLLIWCVLLIVICMQTYPNREYVESLLIGAGDIQDYDMKLFMKEAPPVVTAKEMSFINTGYEIYSGDKDGENYKESTIYLGEMKGKYMICIYASTSSTDPSYLTGKNKFLIIEEANALIDYETILLGVVRDLNAIYKENVTEADFINKIVFIEEEKGLLRYRLEVAGLICISVFVIYEVIKCLVGVLGLPRIKGRHYIGKQRWKEVALKIQEEKSLREGKRYRITEHWFIGIFQGIVVIPIEKMIWIYQEDYSIYIYAQDGRKYCLRHWSRKQIEKMYKDMKEALPWVYQGNTKDLQYIWKKQRMQMIEDVEEGKLDYDLSEWL